MSSGYFVGNLLQGLNVAAFTWSSGYIGADRFRLNDSIQDELAVSAAAPGASPQTLSWDFSTARSVAGIAVLNHNLASAAPATIKVEAADDAAFITGLVTAKAASTVNAAVPYQKDTVLQFPAVSKRYWRLTFTHTGSFVIRIGEVLAISAFTALSRQTVYGSGDTEKYIQTRSETQTGIVRATYFAGPIRMKQLQFRDLKGVSQRDELINLWRATFGGVKLLLYVDFLESTTTAATALAQQLIWGRLQTNLSWTEDDYQVFNVDSLALVAQGREVGA